MKWRFNTGPATIMAAGVVACALGHWFVALLACTLAILEGRMVFDLVAAPALAALTLWGAAMIFRLARMEDRELFGRREARLAARRGRQQGKAPCGAADA